MNRIKQIGTSFFYLVFIVLALVVAGYFIALKTGKISRIKAYVVMSGSMEPSIPTGSIVFVQPDSLGYSVGEPITFSLNSSKEAVTHRVTEIANDGGVISYVTKGDANNSVDQSMVLKDDVVGRVMLTIPYLGFGVDFAKNPYGFVLLVIVPATIIIYEELKNISRQIYKGFVSKNSQKNENEKVKSKNQSENITTPKSATLSPTGQWLRNAPMMPLKYLPEQLHLPQTSTRKSSPPLRIVKRPNGNKFPLLSLVPAVTVILLFVGVTGSFFIDSELSLRNMLGAAATYGSEDVQNVEKQSLVINEVLPELSCGTDRKFSGWVEIYNKSDEPVLLDDFFVSDGNENVNLVEDDSIALQPKELIVLSSSNETLEDEGCLKNEDVKKAKLGGNLNFSEGSIRLKNKARETIDIVHWGDQENLRLRVDQSIERTPRGFDSAINDKFSSNDLVISEAGTPGF